MIKSALFSEFNTPTQAEWLHEIERSLKGRTLADLNWEIPPLSISPFAHANDSDFLAAPIMSKKDNSWAIGATTFVRNRDYQHANQQALVGLMGGVNTPCFVLDEFPTAHQLSELLANIDLDFISIHFREKTGNRSPLSFLKIFKEYAENQGKNADLLRGAVHYNPFADGRHDVAATADLLAWAQENLPLFSVISLENNVFEVKNAENREGVISELSHFFQAADTYFQRLTERGVAAETIAKHLSFDVSVGVSYFAEIAKIRALKLLWGNLLSVYGIAAPKPPTIFAYTTAATPIEDPHTNKIRATTQAMSAVIGGVDVLTLLPSEDSDFGRRIARNVQHLLTMESYLERVADPAAGSFYIENLTTQLAETVWKSS